MAGLATALPEPPTFHVDQKRERREKRSGRSIITTKKGRKAFIEALSAQGIVGQACEVVGISRRLAYHYRDKDPEFAAEWDAACEQAMDRLENHAWARALGLKGKPSDTLLMFLLNGGRSWKYRPKAEVAHTGGITFTMDISAGLNREQLANMRAKDVEHAEVVEAKPLTQQH